MICGISVMNGGTAITYIEVAFGMVDESTITWCLLGGVDPHAGAFKFKFKHVPHRLLRRLQVLRFASFVWHQFAIKIADDFRWHECSACLDATSTTWQIVNNLQAVPLLRMDQCIKFVDL